MERILCRHTVTKAETDFPKDALPAWRAAGWIPVDEWPTDPPAEPEPSSTSAPSEPDPSSTTSRARARSKE